MHEWTKFPEPRGWALQWEGSAVGVDHERAAPGASGAWAPRWERLAPPQEQVEISLNGHGRVRFPGPQAWALEWDGPALAEEGARQHAPNLEERNQI